MNDNSLTEIWIMSIPIRLNGGGFVQKWPLLVFKPQPLTARLASPTSHEQLLLYSINVIRKMPRGNRFRYPNHAPERLPRKNVERMLLFWEYKHKVLADRTDRHFSPSQTSSNAYSVWQFQQLKSYWLANKQQQRECSMEKVGQRNVWKKSCVCSRRWKEAWWSRRKLMGW